MTLEAKEASPTMHGSLDLIILVSLKRGQDREREPYLTRELDEKRARRDEEVIVVRMERGRCGRLFKHSSACSRSESFLA